MDLRWGIRSFGAAIRSSWPEHRSWIAERLSGYGRLNATDGKLGQARLDGREGAAARS
jgi:hypothetical protein